VRWDIFCKVIDNHGDLGVCWRLARDLAVRGERARLFVDDASALAWMAPHGCDGVSVVDWSDADATAAAARGQAPDVLVEGFGCDPAPAVVEHAARQARQACAPAPAWINLEYLSAETYVERLHGLPSPVFHGPGAGLTKHFFYPGFTPATGGLLRETWLATRRERFDAAAWLASRHVGHQGERQGERLVSLFCYEPPALGALVEALERSPRATRLLVTAGRSSRALPPGAARRGALSLDWLPHLPQDDFDRLLWACDLNFVRGEDSLVRALWAGAPFVWQIYPQHDDAHHAKLDAFLDWMDAPASLRRFHHVWNGVVEAPLPPLDDATLAQWRLAALAARSRLMAQDDLATRLLRFVARRS
jgi:uncharacterized repeat protein (TIGR03837 family)